MNRSLRKYLWAWAAALFSLFLFIATAQSAIFRPHHSLAQNEANIEKIVKLDLPEVVSVDSQDNLERGASRWDCFTHESLFEERLSEDCIEQLEQLCRVDTLHWSKGKDGLSYHYTEGDWDEYSISCSISADRAFVSYYIDESEGLLGAGAAFLIITIAFFGLVIWGLTLLVITLVRKKRSNHP